VNPKKFYVFAGGKFYVSTDAGATFTASTATGLPASGDPVRFKAVPGIEGDVWLAGGSNGSGVYGLWHSTNSGSSFTKLANVDKADTIGFGMAAPGQTYPALFSSAQVGGVRGIFRSDNMGAAWIQINDAQHQWGSTNAAITGDPRIFGRVYLSTNGRGIIYGDPNGSPPPPGFSLSASSSTEALNQGATATDTISVTPSGGFSGSVALSASGLPAGVSASFSPASTSGSSTVTFSASTTATTGSATVTITGSSGTLSATTTIQLTVSVPQNPGFSLAAASTAVSITQGSSGTDKVTVTPSGGFSDSVALSASGLPAGVSASFSPASTAGSSTVTFSASTTATAGTATVTITGSSGTLSATTKINVTVTVPVTPDFSLAATSAAVSISQGSSGTDGVIVTPSGGFSGNVALTASGLPAGVTATFNPASTTGTSTLTFAASSTAATGAANVTVTGTSGSLQHSTSLTLTVNPATTGTGEVTVTPVINSNSPYFDDEGIKVNNASAITALSISINVQNTGGLAFNGQYNTVGGQITQSHSSTTSVITYQFGLTPGQTLGAGTGWLFDAQMSGTGTAHPTTGDTFTITYTTGGNTFTQSGHF
jgi:hypothetical protein